jgi:hypothetical protein
MSVCLSVCLCLYVCLPSVWTFEHILLIFDIKNSPIIRKYCKSEHSSSENVGTSDVPPQINKRANLFKIILMMLIILQQFVETACPNRTAQVLFSERWRFIVYVRTRGCKNFAPMCCCVEYDHYFGRSQSSWFWFCIQNFGHWNCFHPHVRYKELLSITKQTWKVVTSHVK